jgi:ketosteroid isomerase-like protein
MSDNVKVRVYGDTAVLTGLDTVKSKRKGQEYVERYLYTDVWVKRGKRWQCVATQSELLKGK